MRLSDRRLLVIETSTSRGSLALFQGHDCLDYSSFVASRGVNSRLYDPLGEIWRSLPGPLRDRLTDVLVGTGPGSYTGVRVAIAVGGALAASIGTAGLHGLISLAGIPGTEDRFLVTGDARRDSFYLAMISGGRLEGEIDVLPRDVWEARLREIQASSELPIFSPDATPPAPGVSTAFPTAEVLGRRFLENASCFEAPGVPIEPIYLAGPYITQPRKAGKTVGGEGSTNPS